MGSGPHPNPLEFATRMRVIKVKNNIDALVPDGANVKLAKDVSDDPCLESELGKISLSLAEMISIPFYYRS